MEVLHADFLPPDRLVLAVFSGSLGSRRINEAVHGALSFWADRHDLAIRHVIGSRDHGDYLASVPSDARAALADPANRERVAWDDLKAQLGR